MVKAFDMRGGLTDRAGSEVQTSGEARPAAEARGAAGSSTVSWPAIFAGAFVAFGVTIILFWIGAGLGFSWIPPWSGHGLSAAGFTVGTVIWLLITQWVASGLGGYIAGRLRGRWPGTHVHEVFFRDTAHGLITWCVATVLIGAAVEAAMHDVGVAGLAGAGAAQTATAGRPAVVAALDPGFDYAIDKLFRPSVDSAAFATAAVPSSGGTVSDGSGPGQQRAETARILANSLSVGNLPPSDRTYLTALVEIHTGLPAADAGKRVDDFVAGIVAMQASAKAEADRLRKAAAEASLNLALSLLIGAFIASVAAVVGGRLRDDHS